MLAISAAGKPCRCCKYSGVLKQTQQRFAESCQASTLSGKSSAVAGAATMSGVPAAGLPRINSCVGRMLRPAAAASLAKLMRANSVKPRFYCQALETIHGLIDRCLRQPALSCPCLIRHRSFAAPSSHCYRAAFAVACPAARSFLGSVFCFDYHHIGCGNRRPHAAVVAAAGGSLSAALADHRGNILRDIGESCASRGAGRLGRQPAQAAHPRSRWSGSA